MQDSNWEEDPLGRIKGVGLITFQYIRMMGGIDTVMPDRIVKRVINEILVKASLEPVHNNILLLIELKRLQKLMVTDPSNCAG